MNFVIFLGNVQFLFEGIYYFSVMLTVAEICKTEIVTLIASEDTSRCI